MKHSLKLFAVVTGALLAATQGSLASQPPDVVTSDNTNFSTGNINAISAVQDVAKKISLGGKHSEPLNLRPAAAVKVALVHDWFTVYSGAERVFEHMVSLFPAAEIFSSFDILPDAERAFLGGRIPVTTFARIQSAQVPRKCRTLFRRCVP